MTFFYQGGHVVCDSLVMQNKVKLARRHNFTHSRCAKMLKCLRNPLRGLRPVTS